MAGERGFARARYVDDNGGEWALLVDRFAVADPNRGWVEVSKGTLPLLPRGWTPRQVFGLDELGQVRRTSVATTAAALWQLEVDTWQLEGSDGELHQVVVLGRLQERASA